MADKPALWKCPFCETLTPQDETLKECPECGYPVRITGDKAPKTSEETAVSQQRKADGNVTCCVLFSLYMFIGATYQVFCQEYFPLFPIQLDGILFFVQLFDHKTGLYISSLIVSLIGALIFWLGLYSLKIGEKSNAAKNDALHN